MFKRKFIFGMAIILFTLLVVRLTSAEPPLPTEFYGTIYSFNYPASSGTVNAYVGNMSCGQFMIVNGGYYGVLSCLADDPNTTQIEGAVNGENITFKYGSDPTTVFGEYYFTSGEYHYVNITYPELICGDGFCDRLETCYSCEIDCFACNATTNQTGNTTSNSTGNETTGDGDSGGSGGSGGAGGGGDSGASGGSSGSSLDGQQSSSCSENWQCGNWSDCSIIGVQNRSCNDDNSCGTYSSKPLEVQECTYEGNCFDNLINCHSGFCEEGVDCGGPCENKCSIFEQPFQNISITIPKFEIPKSVCERKFDFTTPGFWIFILILILSGVIRYYVERYMIEKTKKNENLNALSRSRKIIGEQRKTKVFIISVVFLAIGFLTYGYFFLLCPNIFFEYGWLLLLFILIAPLAVYAISRDLAYNERIHFEKEKRLDDLHYQSLMKMIDLENNILAEEENILSNKLYELSKNDEIKEVMFKYPEIKQIYKLMMELYDNYREKKNPFDMEKDFCDMINKLQQDEDFKKRIVPYPELKEIFDRLQKLYQQYEEKQKLYDEIDRVESGDIKKDDIKKDETIDKNKNMGVDKSENAANEINDKAVDKK